MAKLADSERDEGERVIDRSGDVDQRPPEERSAGVSQNAIVFHRANPALPEAIFVPSISAPSSPVARQAPGVPNLAEIAQRLQKDLDKQQAKAKSQLETLSQKIEAQEKRCQPPKLDDDLQQIRFQRQKVLIANGPLLADCLREERSRLADLETFKSANRLARDAYYASSPILAFGILGMLVLLEAGINGVLFADSSDQGLFGGWLEALVLSITNVGAAFLFGRIVLPQLHRRGFFVKSAVSALSLAGLAVIVAVNLIGAHYRDFKAAMPAPDSAVNIALKQAAAAVPSAGAKRATPAALSRKADKAKNAETPPQSNAQNATPFAERAKAVEREAIGKLFAAPFAFDSFMSFFLFVIGLCGAAVAAIDGYKLDDPFPGYGRRHRHYAAARSQSAEALRRVLGQSNAIMTGSFQAIGRKIESFAHEMSSLLTLHHAYAADHKALQESLEEAAEDAEAQIARHDRLINKVPVRDARETYAVAIRPLPKLSEKQVKFHEAQDKKLKALQKSAQKEQNDVLGVFDAASEDFQKLLADASQASLRAATPAPAESGGQGA